MSINTTEAKQQSTFKPGKTAHCEFEGTVLNANVAWNELVSDLLERGISEQEIADYAECDLSVIKDIQAESYESLWFRAGAKISTLHYRSHTNRYTV